MAKSTKMHILRCFSKLLETNDLDKITVTMLVEKCQISRQTFYYHFADVQALIDWGVMQGTAGCVNEAKRANNMKDATIIYLKEIEKYRYFLTKCFSSSLSGYMSTLIRKSIIDYSSEFYSRFMSASSKQTDVDFIIEFTANGVTGYILSMLYEKKNTDIEEIAENMNNLIFKRLAQIK